MCCEERGGIVGTSRVATRYPGFSFIVSSCFKRIAVAVVHVRWVLDARAGVGWVGDPPRFGKCIRFVTFVTERYRTRAESYIEPWSGEMSSPHARDHNFRDITRKYLRDSRSRDTGSRGGGWGGGDSRPSAMLYPGSPSHAWRGV